MKSREFNKITSSEKLCKFFFLSAFSLKEEYKEVIFNEGWKLIPEKNIMKFTQWKIKSWVESLSVWSFLWRKQLILDIILMTF